MSAPITLSNSGAPPRILLVDDEPMVLDVLRETLRREGFDVVAVPGGMEALEVLRKQPGFAVLLSDFQMPGLTGLQFLAQAKEIQPDATRILITAVVSLDTVIAAINKGEIYRFLVKPWIREELLVTVKNGVQRWDLLRQNAALQATSLALNETLSKLNESLERQVQRESDQNRLLEKTNQALEHNLRRSAELCMKTMQTFYPSLGAQARRTFRFCQALGASLELSKEHQQVLELGALLHNTGLLGVPRELIKAWQRSPQNLSDAERILIEQHPVLGQELVGFIDHLQPVGTVIRSHRERYDGTGYPDRLSGESIPWLARLLAVAVFVAERNEEDEGVLENLKRASGSAFDPEAVRGFLRSGPVRELPRRQREVLLAELRPGMVLARSIYTSSGLLLFPEGQTLNTPLIDKLQNHNRVNPIGQALLVYS